MERLIPKIMDCDSANFNNLIGIRVFDKLDYALDFIDGKFRTHSLSYYSKSEFCDESRFDENEENFEQLISVDLNKDNQIYKNLFNGEYVVIRNDLLKKDFKLLENPMIYFNEKLKNNVLCVYCLSIKELYEMSSNDINNLFNDIKSKGKYVVVFKLQDLYRNILENCKDFMMCGKIIYSDKWSSHPFIKKECYKNEREFRFLFKSTSEYIDYKIKPLKPLLFSNIDHIF